MSRDPRCSHLFGYQAQYREGKTLKHGALVLIFASVLSAQSTFAQTNSPQLFAPGTISGPADDLSPAFLADGNTVFFTRSNGEISVIMTSRRSGGRWNTPEPASFSGVWSDIEAATSPDGAYLIFASNRPADQNGAPIDGVFNGKNVPGRGGNLWRVARNGNEWGAPQRLPDTINAVNATFSPAIEGDGSLYFMRPDARNGNFHIYKSQYLHGAYTAPERLPFCQDENDEVDPAVAADGSFLIYSVKTPVQSQRRLTIVLRKGDGWGEPIDLGDEINEKGGNIEARLSSDNKTLYFSTNTVPPLPYPHTAEQSRQMLEKMNVWANGRQNIWQVSLVPILQKARSASK